MSEGKLIGIAIREKSRAPMVEVDQAEISIDAGVIGDFRGKPGKRQVTVLAVEDWKQACSEIGEELDWKTRRANLLVEGLQLKETTDSEIRIGEVVLRVSFETEPCGRMDEAADGLCQSMIPDWRGGVCCQVVQGGTIQTGAGVHMNSKEESASP